MLEVYFLLKKSRDYFAARLALNEVAICKNIMGNVLYELLGFWFI